MTRSFATIIILSFCEMQAQVCSGEKVVLTENGNCENLPLQLAFEDNFSASYLDTGKWLFTQPWGNHSPKGFDESLTYQTNGSNYKFEEDMLKLEVRNESIQAKAISYFDDSYLLEDGLPNLREWPYTSGMIYSKDAFGYGKFEMRCKIPKGKSFWSVFWLFGINNEEIDVFEFWNEKNIWQEYDEDKLSVKCHMTSHANGKMCETHFTDEDFSKEFHVFTLLWDNYKIEWYVDGELKRRSTKFYSVNGQPAECSTLKEGQIYILNKTFPLHAQMHIGVSLGVQPKENKPDNSTPFPSQLEIDYIRYYKN